ncbi:HK97 gp10 family phage protein [Flintibacter muris]|jgi:hypothetical protein|uniref:HK97 gp10 family phage protein n=1 Tax=Flintibacter muris TaxID=2941327 RepID=UPI001361F6A0|nr:HK97 gp10 family phage protein [Flintibacter muris]NBI80879.1 HK97 gp10 family phage protein [Clostridiaceae bacterium]
MARWGNCDYRQLQKLRENLDRLQSADLENFCRDVSKELAARLLALVIPRTPVGDYSKEVTVTVKRDGKHHKKGDTYTKRVTPSGKKGGTLRRGWTARTEQEAASRGGNSNAKAYAQALPIKKQGGSYLVEVINPVHYASYVEFGHRTPGGKGWVAGQYFLTLSEQDLRALAPALIEKKLEALLREVFRV